MTGYNKTSNERSVFVNPFIEADEAKKAILEKHVKMISTDVKIVNGKKICWNYRKNKCRFGHNCKYAHDSDLQIEKSNIVPNKNSVKEMSFNEIEVKNSNNKTNKHKLSTTTLDCIHSKKITKFCSQSKELT